MSDILNALESIPVAELSYQEWINVGFALKAEGYSCEDWDKWSQNDARYKKGECQRKWRTFVGSPNPITGATILQMAKDRGYTPKPFDGDGIMDWNDTIAYDGDSFENVTAPDAWDPTQQLIEYLEGLYEKDDFVGFVTNDVWQDKDGRWVPSKGVYDRTAGQLIESLKKHANDLGATVGDWKPEVGAWIRFNPVDGEGVKNDNVTSFKYALVESDTMPISDQDAMYRKLELPIAFLVHSGGKSLHAIVRVDASDYNEYRKRVEYLYDFLEKNGVTVDKQNRNPSRLSRMPGVTRNGNRQYIVAKNIGRKSWVDWLDFAEGVSDELPPFRAIVDSYIRSKIPLADELIEGVLRCGHKLLISGPSKAGKSFLLMELAIAISQGRKWLTFQCKKGKVLYINLEIDENSSGNRFQAIYEKMEFWPGNNPMLVTWNLRGQAIPMDKLVPKLIRRMRNQGFKAVIIDPIYKVITGDENNASEMANFCNQFDKICKETGCATIYCHHHSKGIQGGKKAMDRASGSGVFARDPDAQLDIIQLDLPEDIKNKVQDGNATAWRMEGSLREFPSFKPINFWFEYPIHRVDTSGILDRVPTEGSFEATRAKNRKNTTAEEREESIRSAFEACSYETPVTISAMASYLGITDRSVRDRLKEMKDVFWTKNGTVGKIEKTEI